MKQLSIAGRIGKDAEIKTTTQGGHTLCRWTVAVDSRKGQERTTTWVSCTLFGKRGEALAKYMTKGTAVACVGDLEVRTWQDKDGATRVDVGVVVSEVTLLGGGRGGERSPEDRSGGSYDRAPLPGGDDFGGGDFDSIPF